MHNTYRTLPYNLWMIFSHRKSWFSCYQPFLSSQIYPTLQNLTLVFPQKPDICTGNTHSKGPHTTICSQPEAHWRSFFIGLGLFLAALVSSFQQILSETRDRGPTSLRSRTLLKGTIVLLLMLYQLYLWRIEIDLRQDNQSIITT